ncbi:hypothetical protein PIB30_040606 [Stylosanthes scabra]|uniref:Uncharacterized protein n=1 Tax=Stylosanthes scabra TaxID=79078 RepID=A0ABU6RER4_9FABA|nr:hypothetical protein [Stylosanthes scabra]
MIHEGGLFDPTDSLSSSLFTPPDELSPTWSIVFSLMKNNNGLQFSNNTTPFWNASSSPHHDIITSAPLKREESPEKASSGGGSKSGSERAFKRTRIKTPSPLPTFKKNQGFALKAEYGKSLGKL